MCESFFGSCFESIVRGFFFQYCLLVLQKGGQWLVCEGRVERRGGVCVVFAWVGGVGGVGCDALRLVIGGGEW